MGVKLIKNKQNRSMNCYHNISADPLSSLHQERARSPENDCVNIDPHRVLYIFKYLVPRTEFMYLPISLSLDRSIRLCSSLYCFIKERIDIWEKGFQFVFVFSCIVQRQDWQQTSTRKMANREGVGGEKEKEIYWPVQLITVIHTTQVILFRCPNNSWNDNNSSENYRR